MKVNDSSSKKSQNPKKVKSFIKININDSNDNNDFENNDTELKIVEKKQKKHQEKMLQKNQKKLKALLK